MVPHRDRFSKKVQSLKITTYLEVIMNASHPPFRLGDLIDGCSCGVLYIVLVLEKLPVNKKKEKILFALFYKLLSPLFIGGSSNIHLLSRDQLLPTISQENHSACQVTFLLPENSSIFG